MVRRWVLCVAVGAGLFPVAAHASPPQRGATYIGTARIASSIASSVPPGPISFRVGSTGRRLTDFMLPYWYANPTQCSAAVGFGGPGGIPLTASMAADGTFSGGGGQATTTVSGGFGAAGRRGSGSIDYNQAASAGSAGCQFKLPFTVHVAPAIPHGRSVAPEAGARYLGETYQADPISLRVSANGRKVVHLDSTASLRCHEPNSKLEHFDFGFAVPRSGALSVGGSYRDREGAHITLDLSGRFVGARRTLAGTLRLRATNAAGSPCDSGGVSFVANPSQ
jgi:hypothetical protein